MDVDPYRKRQNAGFGLPVIGGGPRGMGVAGKAMGIGQFDPEDAFERLAASDWFFQKASQQGLGEEYRRAWVEGATPETLRGRNRLVWEDLMKNKMANMPPAWS